MDEKNKKAITTISELATMINRGFQGNQEYMDKKFGDIDKKFGDIDKKFGGIDKKFGDIDKKFDELKGEIKKVDKKLDIFIETYSEEKLPMRVEYIENALNLPKK